MPKSDAPAAAADGSQEPQDALAAGEASVAAAEPQTSPASPETAAAANVGADARNTGALPATEGAMANSEPETQPQADDQEARIAEIIRAGLRNGPVARSVEAWNALEAQLPAIAADIVKEL